MTLPKKDTHVKGKTYLEKIGRGRARINVEKEKMGDVLLIYVAILRKNSVILRLRCASAQNLTAFLQIDNWG